MKKTFFWIEKSLRQFGWLIGFLIACLIIYEQHAKEMANEFEAFSQKLKQLEKEKEEALALQKKQLLQINSQNDPAWIELTLMRVLGLVPEGQIKVYFPPDD